MLCFLIEDTLIMFVQDIRGFKNKTASPQEKPIENDPKHFVPDSIFKR